MANFLSKTWSFLEQVAPGRELARGLGTIFAMPGVIRHQEELDKRNLEFQGFLVNQYKGTSDVNRKELIKKEIEDFKFDNVAGEILAEAPNNRQILASSGELALFAAIGYKGGAGLNTFRIATKAAKVAKTAKVLTKAGKALKIGKGLVRESTIGAGLFGLMELQEDETDPDKVIKAMETGALLGSAIYAGSGLIGAGIKALRRASTPLGGKINQALRGIEKTAKAEPVARGNTQIEKTLSLVGDTTKARAARAVMSVKKFISSAKARTIDRFDPIKRMEDKLLAKTGRPLNEYEKLYRDARMLTAASDAQAESLVSKYYNTVRPYSAVSKKAKAYMVQLDLIDRAKLGQKVVGNQSIDDLFIGLRNIVKEIGPDDMRSVIKYKDATNNFHRSLINARVNSGLISKSVADKLYKTHPNYIPHDVLLGIDERATMSLGQSLNVPRTDLTKAIGSVKKIKDPFVAIESRTQIATRTINKNNLLNSMIKVQEKQNIITGMKRVYQTIKTDTGLKKVAVSSTYKPPANSETISLFRNGTRESWIVPSDLGLAIKNLDAPLSPGWLNVLTTPQKILKKFATQYNLSFALPNKFRDKQTAYLTAGSFIDDISSRYGLMKNPLNVAKLSKSQIDDLYNISGGYGSSIFKEGESKIISGLEKKGITKVLSSTNPAKIINTVNEAVERSTRIDVFKQALRGGLNPKDAAFVARDASIDFSKMGTWMQPVNKAIPFLNARVQGFVNLPRAFINNPETFARMQMYTSVYPTLKLHQHNRRYDSYSNIANYYKTKYWIIMTGEIETRDPYNGKPILVPQFITIPKGEGQALVSGPIQYYLDKSDGIEFRKTGEMIADVVGSASPMEFQTFDQGNRWLSLAAQFGPGISVPVGLASGRDPYFGSQIIPQGKEETEAWFQYKKTTPNVIKDIGKALNISPAEIEFTINSFGGLSKDAVKVVDTVYGVVRGNEIGGNPITETPFGKMTQLPISRRFLKESTEYQSPESVYRRKQLRGITEKVSTSKGLLREQAVDILEEMNKKETREEKINYLNSFGNEPNYQELLDKIDAIKKTRRTVEALKTTTDMEERARYIQMRLDEMEQEGVSKEERLEFVYELEANKVLTEKVKELIMKLRI